MNSRIKKWIKDNGGSWNPETESWDFPGYIRIPDYLVKNGRLLIRFGTVGGNFGCYSNRLVSLEGCPREVGGNFYCSVNKLTSLEGCPKEAGGYFLCSYNQLTSLEGAPKKIGKNFVCICNPLESVSGIFDSRISGGFFYDDEFLNLQSDESNQFLIEAMNILKNRFKSVQDKLASKVSRESLEELEDILKTAIKLKCKS